MKIVIVEVRDHGVFVIVECRAAPALIGVARRRRQTRRRRQCERRREERWFGHDDLNMAADLLRAAAGFWAVALVLAVDEEAQRRHQRRTNDQPTRRQPSAGLKAAVVARAMLPHWWLPSRCSFLALAGSRRSLTTTTSLSTWP